MNTPNLRRSCLLTLMAMVGVTLAVAAAVAFFQWRNLGAWYRNITVLLDAPEYARDIHTPERVIGYLQARRDSIALVSYSVTPDGKLDNDQPAIFVNADKPLPLGATQHTLLLAAYAHALEQGTIVADEAVPIAAWERFYIPGADADAHREALMGLLIAGSFTGFAADQSATVTVDTLVRAMVRYRDPAAADWLLDRLGVETVREVIAAAELQPQMLLPYSGMTLALHNHTHPERGQARLDELAALGPEGYAAEVNRLAEAYANDPAWREAELRWRGRGLASDLQYEAHAAARFGPPGSATDYARIMAGVVTGTFLSPSISETMRRHLEWPMTNPLNQETFERFGTCGGHLPGLQSEASFYLPREGDFAGTPRVVALFISAMPGAAYISFSESQVQQAFMRELALSEPFAEQVAAAMAQ